MTKVVVEIISCHDSNGARQFRTCSGQGI